MRRKSTVGKLKSETKEAIVDDHKRVISWRPRTTPHATFMGGPLCPGMPAYYHSNRQSLPLPPLVE